MRSFLTSKRFQSTHPSWGATSIRSTVFSSTLFQSTHPSWGATKSKLSYYFLRFISIHAPIVGCDFRVKQSFLICLPYISIHAPIVGCDTSKKWVRFYPKIFQSTHPSWGATLTLLKFFLLLHYFNPRTHRGVRLSINDGYILTALFQSTHPSWGATTPRRWWKMHEIFQSTHPSWGATAILKVHMIRMIFQSTHPSWGATLHVFDTDSSFQISIHAPIVGCDLMAHSSKQKL